MIRRATPGDLPALLALYAELNPDDPVLSLAQAASAFARMEAQDVIVFVAEANGVVAATCTLVVIANLTRGGAPYGLIENVVTAASFRQRGLGRAVLQHAIATAWADGCYKVMLLTGSQRAETLRFYTGAGFAQSKTGFQIRRPGDWGG